jgi:tRNA(Arg) A34 adenosine deaminase TadA
MRTCERWPVMRFREVVLRLPDWVEDTLVDRIYPTAEDRMRLAIELSRLNIRHGTGGPFGAAIFERQKGELLVPGVNLVVASNCSVFHAEMVAIMVAQQMIGSFDLGGEGRPPYELVASTEPCAMCLGAIPWCGVRHLVCGARDGDASAIGFDEGEKPAEWVPALEGRGITVVRDALREEAASVLREYVESGGEIYNARRGGS